MYHFVKSVWLGALFSPPCWKSALKRNPFSALLFAAVLFTFVDFIAGWGEFRISFLLLCWIICMCLYVISPRKKFKLQSGDNTLYFFLYGTHSKWKQNVLDANYPAIMRVFVKKDGKLRKAEKNMEIRGFDSSLLGCGFFLAQRPYTDWLLFGNSYDKDGKPMELGQKMVDYVFISASRHKKPTAYFLHGKNVIVKRYEGIQRLDKVFLDENRTCYEEIVGDDEGCFPKEIPYRHSGRFLMMEYGKKMRLFKLLKAYDSAAAYLVFTEYFSLHPVSASAKRESHAYRQNAESGYVREQ